jgi:diguanylate cyclase (GGDEF)-like protein
MLDVLRRIDLVGHAGNALVLGALVAATPWFGWLPIVPAAIGGALLQIVESNLHRVRRPEYALAAAWVLACVGNAAAFLVTPTPPMAALPLLTLMIVGFSAVFPARAVLAGGAIQAILMIGVAHGIAGSRLLDDPGILAYPLALLGSVAFIGAAIGRSAIEHRGAAVVDRLTGMLNRTALESRIPQLAHEARVTGEPVAVVVADLDHFKAVNDRHGHAVGDGVLREVAHRLRTELRAFDSAYRFGGEEFLVLLPGMSAATALEVADRMRDVVRAEPVAGLPVTVSLGVAASAPGEPCDFEQLFARADRALYEAKHAGRDRIASADPVAMPLAA